MLADLRPSWILIQREVRDQFRDWRIIFPIVGLTLFFPGLMNYTARTAVSFVSQYGAEMLATRFIPFAMMIVGFFPMTVSLVIALESFAGEAERRTIEPLLSSPLMDWQIYLGKLVSSLLFPLSASYLGILTYLIGMVRSTTWRPEPGFMLQIFLLTTVQAIVMVSAAVVISTQTTSVRAANLLSSFIVLPMALLIQGEAIIMFWGSGAVLWWVILGELVIAILLVRMGLAHFNREDLLGREIDTLNLRNSWRIFKSAFIGQARSPGEWLKIEIPQTLRRLVIPFGAMIFLLIAGWFVGVDQAMRLNLPSEVIDLGSCSPWIRIH
jgi:ABC-type transport system involved in multi-copper enzyme maturation permease subunit